MDLLGSESRAPDAVVGVGRDNNGGLTMVSHEGDKASATALSRKVGVHTKTTPTTWTPGLFTTRSESHVLDPVECVGKGDNGGRLMGFHEGDKALATETSRKDSVHMKTTPTKGISGLSTAAFGYDPLFRSFRPCEQSSDPKSSYGEALGIGTAVTLKPAHLGLPAVGGQVLSHGEQVWRSTEGWGSDSGGNSAVRKGEMALVKTRRICFQLLLEQIPRWISSLRLVWMGCL